jgi:hypothetical protein
VYASLAAALCLNNSHLIRISKRFLAALQEIRTAPASVTGDTKRTFYTGKTARSSMDATKPTSSTATYGVTSGSSRRHSRTLDAPSPVP